MLKKLLNKTSKSNAEITSSSYWNKRYSNGGNSGPGSYGKFAKFKAEVLNNFTKTNDIKSVIEFGCGDGNQLTLANYPMYIGLDVSEIAIDTCRDKFRLDKSKKFKMMHQYENESADLAISLDVIFHLIEDDVYESYMSSLCKSAKKFLIIYSSNHDDNNSKEAKHVRHRTFTNWINEECDHLKLIKKIPNKYPYLGDHNEGSFADFFIYKVLQN